MLRYIIKEDEQLPKLPVEISNDVAEEINTISRYNRDAYGLDAWLNEIDSVINHLSCRVIAWDNTGNYHQEDDGTILATLLSYKISFIVDTDPKTQRNYVYVFKLELRPEDYGLENPLYESIEKSHRARIIHLTDSDLRNMVQESVIKILEESSSKCGPNGYRIMKRGVDYKYNGKKYHSKISVVNKNGRQRYHIDTDDHCYVLYWDINNEEAEIYENPYIFDELLDAIKMLPRPS